jgi:hypothetical protein
MSTLTARLNQNKMHSVDGAKFQEVAINLFIAAKGVKGTEQHAKIGQLVTAINNNQISYTDAINQYTSLLNK